MEIVVLKNYKELSTFATRLLIAQLQKKKTSVLGLATGQTILGLYRQLIAANKAGEISFKKVKTFNLDEFVNLPHSHKGTLFNFMRKNFFTKVDLKAENIYFLDSEATDTKRECRDYEKLLKKCGPVDIQILGIGADGHIGWDEPGTSFKSKTGIVKLELSSRKQQQNNFLNINEVPTEGYSMGIGTIMSAKQIILMASGKEKASIVARALRGRVAKDVPASILQRHPNVIVLLDRDSANELTN